MDVSVVIVNFNTKNLTEACIDSVLAHTTGMKFEIILVDNASNDGSQESFKNRNYVNVVESDINLGFGRANNLGVQRAKGDFLFFLNSDTLLIENSIKKLFDFYILNKTKFKLGVLGCILLDGNLSPSNSGGMFPTPLNDVILYFRAFFQKIIGGSDYVKYSIFSNLYQEVDMVSGADMFISKELFDRLEGFDKNFFLYYEETDLQKRLSNFGFKNFLINSTKIIHLEGSSFGSGRISNFKRIIIQNSRNRYFRKHHFLGYYIYLLLDMSINCTRLFNKNYNFSENKEFVLKNIKSYF